MQPLQQGEVASGSCCSEQLLCPYLVLGTFTPRMGMPGVTSLLPGRLQWMQVSLCSGLEVPAGKVSAWTYVQVLWAVATSTTLLVRYDPWQYAYDPWLHVYWGLASQVLSAPLFLLHMSYIKTSSLVTGMKWLGCSPCPVSCQVR